MFVNAHTTQWQLQLRNESLASSLNTVFIVHTSRVSVLDLVKHRQPITNQQCRGRGSKRQLIGPAPTLL